jgi:hypothetical protein
MPLESRCPFGVGLGCADNGWKQRELQAREGHTALGDDDDLGDDAFRERLDPMNGSAHTRDKGKGCAC